MPIYYNYNHVYFKINGQSILVDSATFGVNPDLAEKEEMDKAGGFERVASGPLGSSLSLTYFLTLAPPGESPDPLKPYLESQTPIPFEVAGMTLGGGYLTSYSFNASPFGPVRVNATIDFFEDFGGSFSPVTLPDQDNKYLQFSDMEMTFQGIDANSKIQSLSYSLSQNIEPVYVTDSWDVASNAVVPADLVPSQIRFGKRASSADIDTYNFQEALGRDGKTASLTFSIGGETYEVSGILASKNVSFPFGQKLSASMSIESTSYGGAPVLRESNTGGLISAGYYWHIYGHNLLDTTTVYFNNNIRANEFTTGATSDNGNDSYIKVKIPRFAQKGPIRVITPYGEAAHEKRAGGSTLIPNIDPTYIP